MSQQHDTHIKQKMKLIIEDFQDEQAAEEIHPLKLQANVLHHEPLEIDHPELTMQQPKVKWEKHTSLIIVALLVLAIIVSVAVWLIINWIEDPDAINATCLALWVSGCSNSDDCCPGLTCQDDGMGFLSCRAPPTPTPTMSPTPTPTNSPTAPPTTPEPTAAPTSSPTKAPTASPTTPLPTSSPTTPAPNAALTTAAPTKSPMEFRRKKIISLLSPYIPDIPSSPIQQQALDWLVLNEIIFEDVDHLLARYVLVIFYFSTNGEEWSTKQDKWLSASPVCGWIGTYDGNAETKVPACNDTNRTVDHIFVSNKNLTGTIPTEIGLLTTLTRLSLGYRHLGVTIPTEIGRLTALKYLELSMNYAHWTDKDVSLLHGTIPTEIGMLSDLINVFIEGNNIQGTIPAEIKTLSSLKHLSLGGNALTGPIPPQLASLTLLEDISLVTNVLTGTIPTQLGSLTALTSIFFDNNHIVGTIPTQFGSLTALKVLDLSNNTLTGTIPTQLGNLTALTWVDLATNALTGTVPTEMNRFASSHYSCWMGCNDGLDLIPSYCQGTLFTRPCP